MRALIACVVLAATAAAHATPAQDLERARSSFRKSDWQSAYEVLNSLLYTEVKLVRRDDVIEAYILLGAALIELQNTTRARIEFVKALEIEPEQTLSQGRFSESAVRLFEDTKAEMRVKLEREAEKKRIAEQMAAIEEYRKSLVVYETRPYYVNFVPLGAGQFQNKQRKKGVLFFSTELAAAGTSAGIFLYLATKYGFVAKVPTIEEGASVRRLQQIEVGAGLVFFGFYAWGVVDSLLHYQPRAQIKGDDSLLPPELRNAPKAIPRKTSLRDRLHLGPVLLPGGAGLGLSLEN